MQLPIPDKTQMRADPLVGAQVGRYGLQERIGDGPRGPVYRGRNTDSGREVAIKVLHEAASERELRAASSLGHPGIAEVLDFGRLADGRHYVVTELLKGEGLDWALRRGPLPAAAAVLVLSEVVGTLAAAHQRSLCHGALRPASVFLLLDESRVTGVKLLDFGVASNASELDDLRALGVLAWAMLTGKSDAPPDPLPSPIAPGVPKELEQLITDLLKPAKLRPQTAVAVQARLAPLRPHAPTVITPSAVTAAPVAAPSRPSSTSARTRLLVLLGAAVLLIGGAIAIASRVSAPDPIEPAAAPPPRAPVAAPVAAPTPVPAAGVEREHEREREPLEARHASKAPKAVASEDRLEERMTRLENRIRKRPGNIDEALFMLNKQRLRLGGVIEADERRDITHQLDLWEQAYLAK